MSTLQVEIVDRLDEEQKREVARLYYQAFTLKFSGLWIFSRKEHDIVEVLSRCLRYENALYAVYEGKVVGFTGLETGDGFFMALSYRALRKTFGYAQL